MSGWNDFTYNMFGDRDSWMGSMFNYGNPSYSGMQNMTEGPISQAAMNDPSMYAGGYFDPTGQGNYGFDTPTTPGQAGGKGGGFNTMANWGQTAVGLLGAWNDWNNFKLKEDMYNTGKETWMADYNAKREDYNTKTGDRNAARRGASGGMGYKTAQQTADQDYIKSVNLS